MHRCQHRVRKQETIARRALPDSTDAAVVHQFVFPSFSSTPVSQRHHCGRERIILANNQILVTGETVKKIPNERIPSRGREQTPPMDTADGVRSVWWFRPPPVQFSVCSAFYSLFVGRRDEAQQRCERVGCRVCLNQCFSFVCCGFFFYQRRMQKSFSAYWFSDIGPTLTCKFWLPRSRNVDLGLNRPAPESDVHRCRWRDSTLPEHSGQSHNSYFSRRIIGNPSANTAFYLDDYDAIWKIIGCNLGLCRSLPRNTDNHDLADDRPTYRTSAIISSRVCRDFLESKSSRSLIHTSIDPAFKNLAKTICLGNRERHFLPAVMLNYPWEKVNRFWRVKHFYEECPARYICLLNANKTSPL
jgi:hypothetical protein